MSVLIKGMRMPENCGKCPFLIEEDIDFDISYQCEVGKVGYIYEADLDSFPTDCPLVDLGKHGDLIDRDEVRNAVFHHLSIKGEENLLPAEKSVFGNIIKAKAVIESEDE